MPFITHAFTITEEMEMFTNTIGEFSLFTVETVSVSCTTVYVYVYPISLPHIKKGEISFVPPFSRVLSH